MKNERPIPEAALRDEEAVEMLRVWIAERKLHCSMKIGMYEESTQIPEGKAWGTILADVARHVAEALKAAYGKDPTDTVAHIRDAFAQELEAPTTRLEGEFLHRH